MKKKSVLITMALVAALSVGNALPVYAYTANGVWSNEQHTTFGIQEGTATDLTNQASFEVPLYVTMAAIDKTDKGNFDPTKLVTPEGYDVKNSATKTGSYIAVQSFDVEMYQDATWEIIANGTAPATDKQMTFSIGTVNLEAQTKGTTKTYATKDVAATNADAVKLAEGTFAKTDGALKPIDAQEYLSTGTQNPGKGIALSGTIQEATRTNNGGGTAAQFRVIYHMVPTDENGTVKTAAAYVGDNKTEAGYK